MEHLWSVICRFSMVNQESRNISLIEVLEQVAFDGDAGVTRLNFPFELVSMWWRTDLDCGERARMRVLVQAPDGNVLNQDNPMEFEVDLEQYPKLRVNARFSGLPFGGTGIYRFILQAQTDDQWKEITVIPLEVTRRQTSSDRVELQS